jgi:hypothetical protein
LDNAVKADSDEPHARKAQGDSWDFFALAVGHALARYDIGQGTKLSHLKLYFGSQNHHAARRHVEKFGCLRTTALQKREGARL